MLDKGDLTQKKKAVVHHKCVINSHPYEIFQLYRIFQNKVQSERTDYVSVAYILTLKIYNKRAETLQIIKN